MQIMQRLFVLFICVNLLYGTNAHNQATVYFDFESYQLTSTARLKLDTIANNNRISALEIYGHCDQLGSRKYNHALSEKRAKAVRDYLVLRGVDSAVITTIRGYGKEHLAVLRTDPISRQANRRVVIEYQVKNKRLVVAESTVPLR